MGDFRAVQIGDRIQKNGGNVASYFLTPDGRVIHSVTGPVSAKTLVAEAIWAVNRYEEAIGKTYAEQMAVMSTAHQNAVYSAVSWQDRKVHELLAGQPLPILKSVYEHVFEKILGQRVSEAAPRLAEATKRLKYAKDRGRPLLFVLHEGKHWETPGFNAVTSQLLSQYVVIVMPIREAPALSQLTNQPPFQASGQARPLFVIADSQSKQMDSVVGWDEPGLARALAGGWASTLENDPPSNVGILVSAQRVLKKACPDAAERVRQLTIKVREQAKANRSRELASK